MPNVVNPADCYAKMPSILGPLATGWRLRSVAPALIVCTPAQTPEDIARPKQIGAAELARCRELGAALAAGLALGVY